LFATFITLYLVPANYIILEDLRHGGARLWKWWVAPFRTGRREKEAAAEG
jgi:hypothetical protein